MATRVSSFAKINLGLAIGAVRLDGFHDLVTLYQTLAIHDVVSVAACPLEPGAKSQIRLTSDHPRVPTDDRNTVWQMVDRALRAMGVSAEVEIGIEKRLPIQGGLGAGSANAAAALFALEREMRGWPCGGDPATPRLGGAERLRLAAEVGSYVPLFLLGGSVLGLGRGEEVVPLPDLLGGIPCVVAAPEVGVSTPAAFAEWDRLQRQAGLTPEALSGKLEKLSFTYASAFWLGSAKEGARSGIIPGQAGSDRSENHLLALVRAGIRNDFEDIVFALHPTLRQVKQLLSGEGSGEPAILAALSGSGSALFGLYGSERAARDAQQRVQGLGVPTFLTSTTSRLAYQKMSFQD